MLPHASVLVVLAAFLVPLPTHSADSCRPSDADSGPCSCSWEVMITSSLPAAQVPSIQASGGVPGTCIWPTEGWCENRADCSGTYLITSTARAGTSLWTEIPPPLGTFVPVRDDPFAQAGDPPKFTCGGVARNTFYYVYDALTHAIIGWVNLEVTCHKCEWNA